MLNIKNFNKSIISKIALAGFTILVIIGITSFGIYKLATNNTNTNQSQVNITNPVVQQSSVITTSILPSEANTSVSATPITTSTTPANPIVSKDFGQFYDRNLSFKLDASYSITTGPIDDIGSKNETLPLQFMQIAPDIPNIVANKPYLEGYTQWNSKGYDVIVGSNRYLEIGIAHPTDNSKPIDLEKYWELANVPNSTQSSYVNNSKVPSKRFGLNGYMGNVKYQIQRYNPTNKTFDKTSMDNIHFETYMITRYSTDRSGGHYPDYTLLTLAYVQSDFSNDEINHVLDNLTLSENLNDQSNFDAKK